MSEENEKKPEKKVVKRNFGNVFEKRNEEINYAILTESNKWLVAAHKCLLFCRCDKIRCRKMVAEIQHARKYCNLDIDSCERCTAFAGFVAYHTKYLCEEGDECRVTWCRQVRQIQKRCSNRFKPTRMKMQFEFPKVAEAVELPDSQEIKAEIADVKPENNNDDFVKQEATEFDLNNIHQQFQVPLFDEVKTEAAEEPEATCLDAPGDRGLRQNGTNCEINGFETAVDILDELISKAVDLSLGIEKNPETADHL